MIITYSSIDGVRDRRSFKTMKGAQAFAHKMVGTDADIGHSYAVSPDGVGKVTVEGATLGELFPSVAPPAFVERCGCSSQTLESVGCACDCYYDDGAAAYPSERPLNRRQKCKCTDYQLVQIGCDCGASDPW